MTSPISSASTCELPHTLAAPAPAVVSSTGALSPIGRGHTVLPGSSVLYAEVYGHPDLHRRVPDRPGEGLTGETSLRACRAAGARVVAGGRGPAWPRRRR